MKTIEEAAKEAIPYLKGVITNLEDARKLFIAGANWQKEEDSKIMYTEEEILNLIKRYRQKLGNSVNNEICIYDSPDSIYPVTLQQWFDSNKKK
jgi:hypothetical protein